MYTMLKIRHDSSIPKATNSHSELNLSRVLSVTKKSVKIISKLSFFFTMNFCLKLGGEVVIGFIALVVWILAVGANSGACIEKYGTRQISAKIRQI